VIAADLAKPDAPKRVFEEAKKKNLAVDLLVNNAGFGTNGPFLDLELARELEMVQVNVTALLELTHRFAGPMKERRLRTRDDIASTAGFQPGPFMTTYYASKAFVLSFTERSRSSSKGAASPSRATAPARPRRSSRAPRATTSRASSSGAASRTRRTSRLDAYRAMMKGPRPLGARHAQLDRHAEPPRIAALDRAQHRGEHESRCDLTP